MGIGKNGVKESRKLSNYDLLMIAVLSGLGGVLSTYIGYLGNLLNRLVGVPFGAGQFVSGLHVFWIIIIAGLIRKPGAATAAGLVKGAVEFFTGSTHGAVIILISLVQGLIVDVVLFIMRNKHNLFTYSVAGGLAAASNVILFQLLYFSGAPIAYIGLISGFALISGILLAGGFGHGVLQLLYQTKSFANKQKDEAQNTRNNRWTFMVTVIVSIAFSVGAIFYFATVYQAPWVDKELEISGSVQNPISVNLEQYDSQRETIRAELKGQVTHIPEQEYTGVPVSVLLNVAQPRDEATTLIVIASDGYQVSFSLADVLADDKMLLTKEDSELRLIAGNYAGGYWVRQVVRLQVE
ncbi:ECF transporter S component [Desulfuribacillus alkaliarsenatis]|uniref:Oxidoreductase molybdopterin-binding domain-containing protein n=1 Tax=Desulfuribacillus alkaliarsenatis TaxID=766136 RepID=A0A1E5FZB0_9FIRM|nr:ECF transporter S component [Desulfuribacillus alkaliarsenatis]OEF95914.1 hypothetical protein BHF68_11020 [Desulfuribacillus alkaliarsenatis]